MANENKRWKVTVGVLKGLTKLIVGDSLLAASFVSYIPAFSAPFRLKLWEQTWLPRILELKIPITEGIYPLDVLTT